MTSDPYRFQAARYALREIAGTDFLAFRAVAEGRFLESLEVLDLGCGAGRSSRFLSNLGNRVTGVDLSAEMIDEARARDPRGTYHLLPEKERLPFPAATFDAFFSSWMMVEESNRDSLLAILRETHRVLRPGGLGLVVTNTPEFYAGHWLTCDVDFPENAPPLVSGQPVRLALIPEGVQLIDTFWSDADYRDLFQLAGFTIGEALYPLGRPKDPFSWKDESHTAPYVIYRLTPSPTAGFPQRQNAGSE